MRESKPEDIRPPVGDPAAVKKRRIRDLGRRFRLNPLTGDPVGVKEPEKYRPPTRAEREAARVPARQREIAGNMQLATLLGMRAAGKPVYGGSVDEATVAARRAANKRARVSRRTNRRAR